MGEKRWDRRPQGPLGSCHPRQAPLGVGDLDVPSELPWGSRDTSHSYMQTQHCDWFGIALPAGENHRLLPAALPPRLLNPTLGFLAMPKRSWFLTCTIPSFVSGTPPCLLLPHAPLFPVGALANSFPSASPRQMSFPPGSLPCPQPGCPSWVLPRTAVHGCVTAGITPARKEKSRFLSPGPDRAPRDC